MGEFITKMHDILNMIKEFHVGYSTETMDDGYMLIEYEGKRYAIKAVEIIHPADEITRDIRELKYFF